MIYRVRWRPLNDAQDHLSRHYLSTADATDFACTLLDQTAVDDIWIVDGSGQSVVRMPEIVRYWRIKKEH